MLGLLGLLFSISSFADNAHVPCNLTNPDEAAKTAAEKRVEGIIRTPDSSEEDEPSESIDSDDV